MDETTTLSPAPAPAAKTSWRVRLALLALGVMLAWGARHIAAAVDPSPMPASRFTGLGGDFTLQSAQGPFALHDLRGKVVILVFGYTGCPDVCPTTLGNVAAALRLLKGMGEIDKVRGLFVTLDPERDPVAKVDVFARYFHSRIVGLGGAADQIASAARLFGVTYEKHLPPQKPNAPAAYSIDHSGYIYIVRPDGQVGDVLSHSGTPKDVVDAIKPWLSWAGAS